MRKKLVIVTHPDLAKSVINRRWMEELRKAGEEVTVHSLYDIYPDEKIDIQKEQALVDAHDAIVLQFPIYWYSAPSLLKKWFDEVMTPDWGYLNHYALEGKKVALAISTGGKAEDYSEKGLAGFTTAQFLTPYIMSCDYLKAVYAGYHACYNTFGITPEELEENAKAYKQFVLSL